MADDYYTSDSTAAGARTALFTTCANDERTFIAKKPL